MITSFKTKLRMASIEDRLSHDLGLRPSTAVWLTRMAWDVAGERNINLMAYRGEPLLQQCLSLLDDSTYSSLLCMTAGTSPKFAEFLNSHRSNSAVDTAQAA
ncbi:hypothetical protein FV139_17235 [Parahaliea maris]|uniref:Uncharacterized protein n=1 Tax=Parahaliea maris TaxID=2716870 RepID=A0A5C8ZSJ2_9GAMM|nr:hypothetical protein [Parahaliea maris]TXS90724.1 hypothetical protein FV139_17235 [Parahaliea maris]